MIRMIRMIRTIRELRVLWSLKSGLGCSALALGGLCMATGAVAAGEAWTATVTYVVDGDTLRVRPLAGGKPLALRIEGIDAPEICQDGGVPSRDALRQFALGQRIVVHGHREDTYGRLLAKVDIDGTDVGGWMVDRGWAWSYRFRRDPGPYLAQERQARAAGLGLFARRTGGSAQTPRDFRKQHGSCRF